MRISMINKIGLMLLILGALSSASLATWTLQTVPTSAATGGLNDVYFFNQLTGVVVGNSQIMLRTVNSGGNWANNAPTTPTVFSCQGLYFPTANVGYAVGANGTGGIVMKTVIAERPGQPIPMSPQLAPQLMFSSFPAAKVGSPESPLAISLFLKRQMAVVLGTTQQPSAAGLITVRAITAYISLPPRKAG
jgi:hypothetical protein